MAQPDKLVPSTCGSRHKVVLVGDSMAFGVGDWILAGQVAGVAAPIQQAAALDDSVRQRWTMVNRGVAGSCCEDWKPPSADSDGGDCFKRVFGEGGVGRDAEVVVVMLGLSNVLRDEAGLPLHAMKRNFQSASALYPEDELSAVAKGVRALAEHLRRQGKKVAIVDLPTTGAVVSTFGQGKVKRINRQLKQICKYDLNEAGKVVDGNTNPALYIPLGSNYKVMKPEHRAFDSLHLNHKGYKVLGVEIYNAIKPMLINCEWKTWKAKLKGDLPKHEQVMKAPVEEFLGSDENNNGAAGNLTQRQNNKA